MTDRARWAAKELAYEFSEPELLERALTHRSASSSNYERLEFLGDAMLSLAVARALYESLPEASEGELSRARAALVKKETLAAVGRRIRIDQQLVLGSGEIRSGGAQRAAALADAVEAVIGAVVLDGGYAAGEALVQRLLAERLTEVPEAYLRKDPKTRLQEWLQARGFGLPEYHLDDVTGSDHNQTFAVRLSVEASARVVSGQGTSRRRAEQAAAEAMLIELEKS